MFSLSSKNNNMARYYSSRDFFRHMPNALLSYYFARCEVFGEFDFTTISETRHDELFAAWLALPEVQRNTSLIQGDVYALKASRQWTAQTENAIAYGVTSASNIVPIEAAQGIATALPTAWPHQVSTASPGKCQVFFPRAGRQR